ncbi:MAG: hypothetical protein RMJ87_00955 [Cytophagales bacterium]|nr:hypothetical protein [Bernardetiaceae bacterium]MDW8203569.1 hypothetical protein [Cytophagales bacterium]
MKRLFVLTLIVWLFTIADAQIPSHFLACEVDASDTVRLQQQLAIVSASTLKDLPASEEKRLRAIFRRLFNRHLKYYKQGSTLADLLQTNHYDCLSGSMLFAYVLQQDGFRVNIYETNIHIFLTVFLSSGKEVLIETTDPIGGLITSPALVSKRKAEYMQRFAAYQETETSHFRSEFHIMRVIPFEALADLQCFNCAVAAYNRQQFAIAADFLFKSPTLMNTERGMELMVLALEGILAHHHLTPEKQLALWETIDAYKVKLKKLPKLAIY